MPGNCKFAGGRYKDGANPNSFLCGNQGCAINLSEGNWTLRVGVRSVLGIARQPLLLHLHFMAACVSPETTRGGDGEV